MSSEDRILIGKITTAHGIKGFVKVQFYGENIDLLDQYGALYTSKSGQNQIELEIKNQQKDVWVCAVEGVNDRNQAEALRGTQLYIDADLLPELEDEEEFYYNDLIGMSVQDVDGNKIGKVTNVENFGAGDLLEIKLNKGKSFYLPFTETYVPNIAKSDGIVTIQEFEVFAS